MKKLILLLLLSLSTYAIARHAQADTLKANSDQLKNENSQVDTIKKIKENVSELKDRLDKLTSKTVRFGLSIGYRRIKDKHAGDFQTASISTSDTTLRLEQGNKGATVLSTSVVITPFKNRHKEISYKVKKINSIMHIQRSRKIIAGESYRKKNDTSFVRHLWLKKAGLHILDGLYYTGLQANLNLLDFTDAQAKYTFNKSIEGGMGICVRLSDKVYYSIHTEIFFSRQLRQYIKDQEGRKVRNVAGNIVTSIEQLDINNDNYYFTKALYGFVNRIIIVF